MIIKQKARFDKDAWFFTMISAVFTLFLGVVSLAAFIFGLFVTIFILVFFRNPKRAVPINDGLIISPADGTITDITKTKPKAEIGLDTNKEYTKISIFLSVFDAHVNRTPVPGVIKSINYIKGRFISATLDKASDHNERQAIVVKTKHNQEIAFVQIAGLVARRIRADINVGQNVETGEVVGIIRFGSRVDIYLPKGIEPLVSMGQTMVAGETILAHYMDWPQKLEFKMV